MSFGGRDRLHGMQLYYHPRSPYSHKVMIALAEKRVAFEPVMVRPDDERLAKLTPLKKVPLLVLKSHIGRISKTLFAREDGEAASCGFDSTVPLRNLVRRMRARYRELFSDPTPTHEYTLNFHFGRSRKAHVINAPCRHRRRPRVLLAR